VEFGVRRRVAATLPAECLDDEFPEQFAERTSGWRRVVAPKAMKTYTPRFAVK